MIEEEIVVVKDAHVAAACVVQKIVERSASATSDRFDHANLRDQAARKRLSLLAAPAALRQALESG